jgi:uncharacterized membrane-anchored protein YitT (DUF2179 family)
MDSKDENLRHSVFQDIFGIVSACSFMAFGVLLLKAAHIATGGVAGVALLISYIIDLPLGILFTLINIPFFIFGYFVMGREFIVKTAFANFIIMAMTSLFPKWISLAGINPIFASIFGGIAIGTGILGLARHGTGAGGTGILALYLQKLKGINAGRTLLITDFLVLLSSLLVFNFAQFALSILNAVFISLVLVSFHKPGLYRGY